VAAANNKQVISIAERFIVELNMILEVFLGSFLVGLQQVMKDFARYFLVGLFIACNYNKDYAI